MGRGTRSTNAGAVQTLERVIIFVLESHV